MNEIDGKTKLLGLMGYPVEHTYSPQMHNYISKIYNRNYAYSALSVKPENLCDAIRGIVALNYAGVNVTAPHKEQVMQYLDFISEDARRYGSVNTVRVENGKLYGYNTDADGFYLSLLRGGIEIIGKDVLILGAGGAARPICVKFSLIGAKSVTVINRTQSRADELAEFVKNSCGKTILTSRAHSRYDVVINTTSVGMEPNVKECPLDDFSFVDSNTAAADMIYNPSETVFLKKMKEHGAYATVNGLGMLIYQGIVAYEIFTGEKIDHNIFDDIKREVFGL